MVAAKNRWTTAVVQPCYLTEQTTPVTSQKMYRHIQKVLFPTNNTCFDALAKTAVERSLIDIRTRLDSRWRNMTPSQARGYVRARARQVVRRQAGLLAAEHGYRDQASIDAIDTRALERSVNLIIQELMVTPRSPPLLRIAG